MGACHWLLADKNNPLTIFNSRRSFGEQSLDAFLTVAKGLQRLRAKTDYFIDFFLLLLKSCEITASTKTSQRVTLVTLAAETVLAKLLIVLSCVFKTSELTPDLSPQPG